jgi:hypothetical protein
VHVEIKIVAKDYDKGKQATRTEEVEIPAKVLKLFEMFTGGDPEKLLRWVADTIFGTALREVQGSGKSGNLSAVMTEAGAGRVGGRSAPGENAVADNLGEQLGLDVLRAGVAKDRGQAAPPAAPPQPQQPPQAPPAGPGPIGFGGGQQPPQIGPGPVGFAGNQPINPGPGPGPVGFGPDRNR